VHSFINFNSKGFRMIKLLADEQVKSEEGPRHGSWELGEDCDLFIEWHFRGIASQVRHHRYAQLASTEAWQLVERDHDMVENITFLFPVAQSTTQAPPDFLHFASSPPCRWGESNEGIAACKLAPRGQSIVLREDGSVKFNVGSPHGSWHRGDNGDLVVNWRVKGEEEKTKNHRYRKLPFTDAWHLIYRGGYSVDDVTLLLPISAPLRSMLRQ
jgi:hypothetical protein